MNRPMMTAEQTNIPQTEEEVAAAQEKKRLADQVEAAAHEAARSGAPSPQEIEKQQRIANASHGAITALWDIAAANGSLTHHVNAILFAAAVVVANAKTHGEQVRIIEYITKTAAGLQKDVEQERAKANHKEH